MPKSNKGERLEIRVTPEMLAHAERLAQLEGLKISDWVRGLLAREITKARRAEDRPRTE